MNLTATKTKQKTKVSNKSLNEILINLFNKALETKSNPVSFKDVSEVSVKVGYLIHPSLCNEDIYVWLNSQKRDYNSTFYKSWNDIISKSRFELYIDQLRHYASTYGTSHTGEVYLPEGEVVVPELKKFKVILPITQEEVVSRCENMLFSGIALKQETIEDILTVFEILNHKISDINKVKNKETKMFLFKQTNSIPNTAVEMVRFLIYLATDKTLLIKDKETIEAIKLKKIEISSYVNKFGLEELSSVFLRFKPIFLAFRNTVGNRQIVNRLRRLAKTNHEPMKIGYFEKLLSSPESIGDLEKNLNDITNFKKITLLQTILVRQKQLNNKIFVIRNQKMFVKQEQVYSDISYLSLLYDVIYKDLVESVKKNKCKVKLQKGVNLTLPTSEKSFIGNYPLGTSFDFSDSDNIVGINWRGEDGAQDLDLKLIDVDGKQYGWNAAYKNSNNSILYSGDMTSAEPEATELFYTTKEFNPCIVKVNLFYGSKDAKFRFFLAKEKLKKDNSSSYGRWGQVSHMVDPNNILVNVECQMDSNEKTLGVITENKFILAQFRVGRGRVAYNSVTNLYTEYALNTLDCYISLENLLKDAGFTITDTNPDVDLTELSKDSLMNLLKK
jgi:hypothetical protein